MSLMMKSDIQLFCQTYFRHTYHYLDKWLERCYTLKPYRLLLVQQMRSTAKIDNQFILYANIEYHTYDMQSAHGGNWISA